MKTHVVLLAFIAAVFSQLSFSAETESSENNWIYDDNIYVPSILDPNDPLSEQIGLPANIFIPNSDDPNQTFPAIIFISSWALNEHEYASQAEILANNGYVVLSYTARGFHGSPDEINTAGERDRFDVSAAIDYLIDSPHIPVDPNAIGLSGVSYGAGLSLLGGFTDDRVKAIAAMSAWGDLVESLWAGYTPNYAWLELLTFSSQPIPFLISNNPSPEIEENYANMRNHVNVEDTKVWGYARSPISYLDQVNSREEKPAVFISNNIHDYLFQPDTVFRMLDQYEGEWRFMLNRGTHASGEAGGLLGRDDHIVWQNVGLWFDHYLKGVDNGINESLPFSTKVLNTGKRESYDSLHPEDENLVLNLVADSGSLLQELSDSYANDSEVEISFNTEQRTIYSGWVTGALEHTGRSLDFNNFDTNNGIAFLSPVLEEAVHLRGEAKVNIQIIAEDKAQYFGYLLYLDPETGEARWVSHAPFSCHASEGCAAQEGELQTITLDFYWTSVDFPAGTQILLIIDGKDDDYWRYDDTPSINTVVFGTEEVSTLSLPIVWDTPEYDDPVVSPDNARSASGDAGADTGEGLGGAIPLPLLALLACLVLYRRQRSLS